MQNIQLFLIARAPELLYGSRVYNESVDLWSVGCIFGELLNNSPIFPGENDIDQLGIVIRALGTPNERIWPGVKGEFTINNVLSTVKSMAPRCIFLYCLLLNRYKTHWSFSNKTHWKCFLIYYLEIVSIKTKDCLFIWNVIANSPLLSNV